MPSMLKKKNKTKKQRVLGSREVTPMLVMKLILEKNLPPKDTPGGLGRLGPDPKVYQT